MSYSLFLYPDSIESLDDRSAIKSELQLLLIQHQLANSSTQTDVFEPGEHLMAYINFLGCSPSLSAGELTATIRIHQFKQLAAMGGQSVDSIRYPGCNHPVPDPVRLLNDFPAKDAWVCDVCGNEGTLNQINWRKSSGISTLFIEITSIFPKEAIPTEKLLNLLYNFNQCNWSWFYSRSSH